MARFDTKQSDPQNGKMPYKGKFTDNIVKKPSKKKNNKQILRGANAWRDVDDRPEEEIAKENFEKRKLYKINEKGEKIKEFSKQGAVRPWLDLKFEENDRMTYYNGFYVKKDAVDGLDKMKLELEFEGVDKRTINRKMMKAIRKAKRELFKEMLYEEKLNQIKSGTYKGPVKVWNKKDQRLEKDGNASTAADTVNDKQDLTKATAAANNNKKPQMPSECRSSSHNTIEGLDLNYEFGSVDDDEEEDDMNNRNNDASMDFNGIPYSIIDTNVDKLDDESDDEEQTNSQIKNVKSLYNEENQNISVDNNTNDICRDSAVKSNDIVNETADPTVTKRTIAYEENKLMTCVEGFWIRRTQLLDVDRLRTSKRKEIITAREEDTENPVLSIAEEKKLKLAMKKELHRMANQLRSFLQKQNSKKIRNDAKPKKLLTEKKSVTKKVHTAPHQRNQRGQQGFAPRQQDGRRSFGSQQQDGRRSFGSQQQDGRRSFGSGWAAQEAPRQDTRGRDSYGNEYSKKTVTNPNKPGMVRFDGYWVTQDAGDRLRELKDQLKGEGVEGEKLAELMKQARRREENDVKQVRKTVCFSCRESGHMVADCPLKQNTGGVGACFKCGSLEHQSSACKVQAKEGSSYSYATCFICRQKGHISKECPKNTRGLYPDGGGCTLCDSNQHLIKDCPRNVGEQQRTAAVEVTAGQMKAGQLLEVMDEDRQIPSYIADNGPSKNKYIRF